MNVHIYYGTTFILIVLAIAVAYETKQYSLLTRPLALTGDGEYLPEYILARGGKAKAAYQRALEEGKTFDKRVKSIGHEIIYNK